MGNKSLALTTQFGGEMLVYSTRVLRPHGWFLLNIVFAPTFLLGSLDDFEVKYGNNVLSVYLSHVQSKLLYRFRLCMVYTIKRSFENELKFSNNRI